MEVIVRQIIELGVVHIELLYTEGTEWLSQVREVQRSDNPT